MVIPIPLSILVKQKIRKLNYRKSIINYINIKGINIFQKKLLIIWMLIVLLYFIWMMEV